MNLGVKLAASLVELDHLCREVDHAERLRASAIDVLTVDRTPFVEELLVACHYEPSKTLGPGQLCGGFRILGPPAAPNCRPFAVRSLKRPSSSSGRLDECR